MQRIIFVVLFLLAFGTSGFAQGPGTTGVVFLLIQPSPRSFGMANTSVATTSHDPLSIVFNPAHLGISALKYRFTTAFYPSAAGWLPQLADDLSYNAKSFATGYNFKQMGIPISLGLGYTRTFIDLGEQTRTNERGDEVGKFRSNEHADVWSFGIGFDSFIKAAIGLNFKDIDSIFEP